MYLLYVAVLYVFLGERFSGLKNVRLIFACFIRSKCLKVNTYLCYYIDCWISIVQRFVTRYSVYDVPGLDYSITISSIAISAVTFILIIREFWQLFKLKRRSDHLLDIFYYKPYKILLIFCITDVMLLSFPSLICLECLFNETVYKKFNYCGH